MTYSRRRYCSALAAGVIVCGQALLVGSVVRGAENAVRWRDELAKCDLTWDQLPKNWMEAPFLGNGEQGTMMYREGEQTLRWDIGNSAAHDHRPPSEDDFSEKNVEVLNRGRLFIGHLRVEFPEKLRGSSLRLSLWDAEAKGEIRTAGGHARWSSIVHAKSPVMRFDIATTGTLTPAKFVYVPAEARNPRAVRAQTLRNPANPPAVLSTHHDGVQTAVHNLYAGGQTAVAWYESKSAGTTRLWLSVMHSYPGLDAETLAVEAVRTAASADQSDWLNQHRQWWHRYYQRSYLSTGDPYWDAFYWIQQYKLASATRAEKWIIDNQGPWLQPTAWNALWWNLNVQLSHSGFATANRRGMGAALGRRLDQCRDQLAMNVAEEYRDDSYAIGRSSSGWDLAGYAGQPGTGRPPKDDQIGRECGNLLWALHNVDLEYKYWQDTELRDRVLFPLLVRAVNYYLHFLVEEPDGYLHLPKTYSPEYRIAENCTYDLDLLRWASGRLLALATEKRFTQAEEPLIAQWQNLQSKLVPTHIDETGRMIGRDVALSGRHRHWSHLLAIYPLRTLTPDIDADRKLIELSLNHWHRHGPAMAGYSVTGGACMAALLGDGDRAYEFLNRLKSFLHPNTLYSEAGSLPVMETPLHGATAIQDMVLQSWGGRIRVFPAVPQKRGDVQFDRLRAEGAFLVSAKRESGKTQWAEVTADAGGSVEVQLPLIDVDWSASDNAQIERIDDGVFRVVLPQDGSVLFWPTGQSQPTPRITATPSRLLRHPFGGSSQVR